MSSQQKRPLLQSRTNSRSRNLPESPNISSIRNDSMSSISSETSKSWSKNRTFSNTPSEFDYKKGTSEDLIKNIENLVNRNRSLEEENTVLRNLIQEENKNSNFDERRVLMLKCQIYQLEKQINIISKSLSFRKYAQTDSFNTLSYLTDSFRSIIQTNDNKSMCSQSSSITIDKNELIRWIEMSESSKLKFIKSQNEDSEGLNVSSDNLLFESNYSKTEINILDVCSGNLNHVNLKQVANLESNLSQLYKKLSKLRECLKTVRILNPNEIDNIGRKKSDFLPHHSESLKNQLDDSLKMTSNCCRSLFDLSLLVPSAPWGEIKKSSIGILNEDLLMNKLKTIGLTKQKQQSVEILLKSLFISSNYHYHMKTLECTALNEELSFYRSCYSIQKSYVESVMKLFKSKYEQFMKELSDSIRDPLRILIDKFWLMKEKSTEENLKEFLNIFKSYAKIFDKVIQHFDTVPNEDLITKTFDQLLTQLNIELTKLNESSMNKMDKINLENIDLKNLTIQSDELLLNYVNPIDHSSPES